jgi:hypothetical protein
LHLPVFVDSNLAPATTTKTYAILNTTGGLVQNITEPFYTTRLNPQTGVILTGESVVNSWYNGLLLTVRRRMSHGVEFVANYTFSKSIDDGAVAGQFGTFYGTDDPVNPYNIKAENALSDLNQRHRFVGSVIWDPFQHFRSSPGRWLLRGFVFSAIATEATGMPEQSNISGFPSDGVDGGLTGGAVSNQGSATGGRAPEYGRNIFTGPQLHDLDFRIMRKFAITERFRLQFLGEAFNVLNETNINGTSLTNTAYNFVAPGKTGCVGFGAANGCLVPNPTFLAPSSGTSTNGLYGPRQLQFSAKLVF